MAGDRPRLIPARPHHERPREGVGAMPMFPALTFRRSGGPTPLLPEPDLSEHVRRALPMRFEAVGEALLGGAGPNERSVDVIAACTVVGRDVARDGAALGEALSGLRTTY